MSRHIACSLCVEARAASDFRTAMRCYKCKGTGIVRDPDDYVCNRCSGSLCVRTGPDGDPFPFGLIEHPVSGGFDSPHLTDCTTYVFSLCEMCLRELFAGFKIPPETLSDVGDDRSYAEDVAYYRVRDWRRTKDYMSRLDSGTCNAAPECSEHARWRTTCSGHLTDEALCDSHRSSAVVALNIRLVSAEGIWDVPLERSERTLDQKLRLAAAYLSACSRPDGSPVLFRYVGDCVCDLTGASDQSCVWVPSGAPVPDFVRNPGITAVSMPSGTAFLGEPDVVWVAALGAGILEEPGVDELYPRSG